MVRLLGSLAIALVVAGSSWSQSFATGFEPTEPAAWPTAPWNDVIPSTVAFQAGGLTFAFENWEIWSGNGFNVFMGSQGARARQPEVLGLAAPARLSVTPVVDPAAVVFKMAARTLAPPGSPDWTLTLRAIDLATGVTLASASWTNERGGALSGNGVLGRQVAHLAVPPGAYTLELALAAAAPASNPPYLMLDDLEIHGIGDPPPPDLLPLETVTALLDAEHAVTEMPPATRAERQWLIDQLDRHAVAYDAVHDADATAATPFTAWYRARAREAVEHLDACAVGPGEACITKLYSSSYVVKTAACTFATDLVFGPNPDGIVPVPGIAMALEDDTMLKLARRLDFLLVTHYHDDHASYPVIYLMDLAGKPVYGPAAIDPADTRSLVEHFEGSWHFPLLSALAPDYCDAVRKIVDPTLLEPHDASPLLVGPQADCELRTFAGRQAMATLPCGVPPAAIDPTNHAFHLTTPDGLRFLVVGDHRDNLGGPCPELDSILDFSTPDAGWWPRLWAAGLTVDLKLGAGPLVPGAPSRLLGFFGPLVRNDGHEWEMSHTPINRLSASWSAQPATKEQALPVSFGERFHFRAFPVPPYLTALTSSSATLAFETALPVKELDIVWRADAGPWQSATTIHSSPSHAHAVTLAGLAPGTTYEYAITCRTLTPGDATPGHPPIPLALRDGPWFRRRGPGGQFTTP